MKLEDFTTSKFLKGADVPKPQLVTVEGCERTNVAKSDEPPEYKLVVNLVEHDAALIVNVTNAKKLFRYLGNDTDEWIGKKFVLYFDEDVEFGGRVVGGLRVREYIPKTPQQAPKPAARPARDVNADLQVAASDDFEDSIPFN